MPSTYRACLTAAAIISMALSSSAHLILKSPVPFGLATINNSPLVDAAIGSAASDFPCKQRPGVYDISQVNYMKVGDPQTLSFSGSASHGGGTCQLAVSMDLKPTANSIWKLIQVYEGGCPITGDGNDGTDTFTYKIPEKFPNGNATLAWTWFNRIGNREIYMNCAPISVTGGADDQDYYNTLPDMYVINLPTSQCSTIEKTNQKIPDPGQFVISGDPTYSHVAATGPACAAAAAAQTNGVSGSQTGASSNGTGDGGASNAGIASSAAATTAVAPNAGGAPPNNGQYTPPSAAAPTVQPTSPSGMTTVASSAAISLPMSAAPVATPATSATAAQPSSLDSMGGMPPSGSPSAGSSSNSTASAGTPSGGSSTASGGSSCSQEGAVVCNGPSQFGLCDHGQVVWQSVAAGTTCSNGAIQRRAPVFHPHARRHAELMDQMTAQ